MAAATKMMLALLLLVSVLFAYLGPPPRWRVPLRMRGALLTAGLIGYAAAAAALATGAIVAGALTLALAGATNIRALDRGWLSNPWPWTAASS